MEEALSAPNGLQDTVALPNTCLKNCKFTWFNDTFGEMNVESAGGKVLEICLNYGRISENKFETERNRLHYAGASN